MKNNPALFVSFLLMSPLASDAATFSSDFNSGLPANTKVYGGAVVDATRASRGEEENYARKILYKMRDSSTLWYGGIFRFDFWFLR